MYDILLLYSFSHIKPDVEAVQHNSQISGEDMEAPLIGETRSYSKALRTLHTCRQDRPMPAFMRPKWSGAGTQGDLERVTVSDVVS